ncbi:MAG: helix-turn-helix transcriptional regulator [Planctomycetaceae bacterium]
MDTKLLNGTLEMMMLEVLSQGPSYGYEIVQTVLSRSGGQFELKEGSLYPALHRLERQQLLSSYWTEHEGRRRKYYKLSAAGRKAPRRTPQRMASLRLKACQRRPRPRLRPRVSIPPVAELARVQTPTPADRLNSGESSYKTNVPTRPHRRSAAAA